MSRIPKSVVLCIRGLELSPKQVALIFGAAVSESGVRGEFARPAVKAD